MTARRIGLILGPLAFGLTAVLAFGGEPCRPGLVTTAGATAAGALWVRVGAMRSGGSGENRLLCVVGIDDGDAVGDRSAKGLENLLGLILVNVHV